MAGPYQLIYIDLPWGFDTYNRETGTHGHQSRAAERHYDTMAAEQMVALPIEKMAADNALMQMWIYDPHLPLGIDLARAWGFEFVTVLFRWIKTTDDQLRLFDPTPKPNYGLGYHTRGGACEEVFLFRRGKGLPVLRHDIRKEFFAPVREHSRKPDTVPGWIVDLYGDVPRVECFARTRRPGWDVAFSNQADKFKGVTDDSAA